MEQGIIMSVHQKLRNLQDKTGEPLNNILIKYGLGRLLYRLELSGNIINLFVLKGAMLFSLWEKVPRRSTRDIDLLGFGISTHEQLKDFYDLYILLKHIDFSDKELSLAIKATFERRKIPLPKDIPVAFTHKFIEDGTKDIQWKSFIKRNSLDTSLQLLEILKYIEKRLLHILINAGSEEVGDVHNAVNLRYK